MTKVLKSAPTTRLPGSPLMHELWTRDRRVQASPLAGGKGLSVSSVPPRERAWLRLAKSTRATDLRGTDCHFRPRSCCFWGQYLLCSIPVVTANGHTYLESCGGHEVPSAHASGTFSFGFYYATDYKHSDRMMTNTCRKSPLNLSPFPD